ncbi:unnamed protein product [Debaryomyces tyrocola]|nr:unnamed protein product [Debaryomyces tyrocola]
MTNLETQPYDPFMAKATKSEARLTKLLETFQNYTANSDILSSDTTIVYLVLKSNFILNNTQIRVLLGLGDKNKVNDVIYHGIQRDVKYAASKLFSIGKFSYLLEMPLTDLKQLCYEIALKYKTIFFVPVESKIKVRPAQNDFTSILDTTQFDLQRIASGFIPSSHLTSNLRNQYNRAADTSAQSSSMATTTTYHNITLLSPQGYCQADEAEYVEIIKFISKFNQMWIIAAFLNREYQELQIN